MIVALVVVVLLVGAVIVFGLFGLAFWGMTRNQQDLTAAVAAGDVSRLGELPPAALGRLSGDVVGSSYYFRPMGGARTSKLAATVHALDDGSALLAIAAESTPRAGQLRIDVVCRGPRLALHREGASWHLAVDGRPTRILDPVGNLHHADKGIQGSVRRDARGAQVIVNGIEVAWVHGAVTLHAERPPALRPLVELRASPDRDAAIWVLAVCAITICEAALDRGGGASGLGVP